MKQLILYTGGHKFHTEDFTHLQSGVLSTMSAIIEGNILTGATFVKLSGGVLSGTDPNHTWTEGVVWFEGDFYILPANAVVTDIDATSFDLVDIPEANNPVTYRDGSSQDVHITKTLSLRADTGGVVDASLLRDTSNINERIANKLITDSALITKLIAAQIDRDIVTTDHRGTLEHDGWTSITSFAAGWTELESVQFKLINGVGQATAKTIELRGKATYTGGATNPDFFEFPASSLLPTIEKFFTIARKTASAYDAGRVLVVPTTGFVRLEGFTGSGSDTFVLDGIKFRTKL